MATPTTSRSDRVASSASVSETETKALIFPMSPKTLLHRHGGKVVKVHGIAHCECRPTEGRSRDYWYFDCDVLWDDSGTEDRHEVEAFKLACDDPPNNAELKALMEAMNAYLLEHGAWYDTRPHEGWYAHRNRGADTRRH